MFGTGDGGGLHRCCVTPRMSLPHRSTRLTLTPPERFGHTCWHGCSAFLRRDELAAASRSSSQAVDLLNRFYVADYRYLFWIFKKRRRDG